MKSVRPKKFLGQHFLTHLPTAQAIADTVDACPELPILEVGPGMGVMTQFILPKKREFKVVEIDFESVAYLREHFPELEDNIIEDDFLKMHLEHILPGEKSIYDTKIPQYLSGQIILCWDKANVERLLNLTFGNSAQFNIADIRTEAAKLYPSLKNLPLSRVKEMSKNANVSGASSRITSVIRNRPIGTRPSGRSVPSVPCSL